MPELAQPPLDAARHGGARTLELMDGARRYSRWIYKRLRPGLGRRVLEIGCGIGSMTSFLLDRELVVGVDVVSDYVRIARERFHAYPTVTILQHDVSLSIDALRPFRFDSAMSVNVFEHIEDDQKAILAVCEVLQPGGTLALFVPAHPALLGRFDRSIGHFRRYTKGELRRKLETAGFRLERLRSTNPIGAIGWFVNVQVFRQQQLRGVATYDRAVPLLARLERLAEPPFGLSLVAIGRRD